MAIYSSHAFSCQARALPYTDDMFTFIETDIVPCIQVTDVYNR